MTNIKLINQRNSKVDLSSVNDAAGKMIILQPKGTPGDWRECLAETLEHPHVQTALQAKWVRYESVSLIPLDTAPPAATTAEGVTGEPGGDDADDANAAATTDSGEPVAEPAVPVVDPAVEPIEPPAEPVVEPAETVTESVVVTPVDDVIDVTATATNDSKRKKRER